ncbi:MAG: heat-inducible transcriptional repressor HrcA [bacterium]
MISNPNGLDLNDREKDILRHVVYNYIQTATPIGSRYISKRSASTLSPATIRNSMADLEERGFLFHPHTSAGRVPTDLGYRFYIEFLMEVQQLSDRQKLEIAQQLDLVTEQETLLRETSKILGKISKQLSIVASPHISSGIFERLELIPISSVKLLVVMSIRSGLVKTIMLEVRIELPRQRLENIARILNERLNGLSLEQIRNSFPERIKDLQDQESGLIRLFIDSVDILFSDAINRDKVHISGAQNIIDQPEFIDPKKFRSVIELIENNELIVHLLEKHEEIDSKYTVTIGTENEETKATEYSFVSGTYDVQGLKGRIGVMGPKRMDYAKVIPLVDYVAKTIARILSE